MSKTEDTSTAHEKALLIKMLSAGDRYTRKFGIPVIYKIRIVPGSWSVQRGKNPYQGNLKLVGGKFYVHSSWDFDYKTAMEVYANGTAADVETSPFRTETRWCIDPNGDVRRENILKHMTRLELQ